MKIFLISYGGGHITAILPTYKALTLRGHECVVMALTTAGEVARRERIPHCRPIDFVCSSDPLINSAGMKLAEQHHTDGKGISLEESIAYLGVSFRDLARELSEEVAWERYTRFGLNAFTPVHFMRSVLSSVNPDVVVATTSPRMEKASLRAAFQLNIPSLCMVELFGLLEEAWLSRPDNGHVLAVSREDVKHRLVSAGRQACDIHLTGSPMFDALADPKLATYGVAWRGNHGVRPDEKLVFWAEQPEPDDPELPKRVRFHLANVCNKHGWRLVIRFHPSSTDPKEQEVPDGCLQSLGTEPVSHVISACDVGVTLTSTVGWELLLANKPLLIVSISAFSSSVTYGNDDGSLVIDKLDDSEFALMQLLQDSELAKKLDGLRASLPQAGGAAERISDLIENVVFPRQYSLEQSFSNATSQD